jgi:hypothetical protein
MIFIPVYSAGKGKIHEEEATIAAHVAMRYQRKNEAMTFTEKSLGIITPFRAQIMEIRKRICPKNAAKKLLWIQWSDFKAASVTNIIISFASVHSGLCCPP